jgi:hypothetical protein
MSVGRRACPRGGLLKAAHIEGLICMGNDEMLMEARGATANCEPYLPV